MKATVNSYKEAIDLVAECIHDNKEATLENVNDEKVAFSIGECSYLFYRNFATNKYYRYHIKVLEPNSIHLKEYTFLYVSEAIEYILKEIEKLPKEASIETSEPYWVPKQKIHPTTRLFVQMFIKRNNLKTIKDSEYHIGFCIGEILYYVFQEATQIGETFKVRGYAYVGVTLVDEKFGNTAVLMSFLESRLPKETPNQGGEIMKQIHSFGISVETVKALDTAIELLKQPQPGLDPFPVKHFKALKELEVTRANMLSVMDMGAIEEYLKS